MADPKDDKLAKIQAENDEKKAKDESLIQVFLGLGIILFGAPLGGFLMWFKYSYPNPDGSKDLGYILFFGASILGFFVLGIEKIITPITAVGERGNANRSALMIIGFFLLILVVIVFGTILVLK